MRECKYFNSPVINEVCKAKVNYREIVGGPQFGWMARLPCIPNSPLSKPPLAKCLMYVEKTKAEQEAEDAEMLRLSEVMLRAFHLIRKDGRNSGVIKCPECKKDTLQFKISGKRQAAFYCLTLNCIRGIT